MNPSLAVIIPAYRKKFLQQSLMSLSLQTNKNFNVYIGDDASSENLHEIVTTFSNQLSIDYFYFQTNLGGQDLVGHWHRCIQLARNEPWIWLFSDDDVADKECVSLFYKKVNLRIAQVHLYRFNMEFIDGMGRCFYRPPDHPSHETLQEFFQALLTDNGRQWRAPDHIFSRTIYEKHGGFVKFPKALHSDFATWLTFASEGGVETIAGAKISWRDHDQGTSSGLRQANRAIWISALGKYLTWLSEFSENRGSDFSDIFNRDGPGHYYRCLALFRPLLNAQECNAAVGIVVRVFKWSRFRAFLNLHFWLLRSRSRNYFILKAINKKWNDMRRIKQY